MHHFNWVKLGRVGAALAAIAGLLAAGPARAAAGPIICVTARQSPAAGGPAAPAAIILPQPGQAYLHMSTSDNTFITPDSSYLENPALNGQPATKLLATSNVAPYGIEASGLNHPLGVWYDICESRWAVYNDDQAAMTVGRAWNVFIPPQDATLIMHPSTALNTVGPLTRLEDPQFGDSGSVIFVQHVYNPPGGALSGAGDAPQGGLGNYFTKTVGVTYNAISSTWAIRTEDGSNFQLGKTFFALRASSDETAFTHTVTAGSHVSLAATALDHPALNGNPDAQILITQNLDGGVANNHEVGVTYDAPSQRWRIVNLDNTAMPLGARFNVLVIPPKHGSFVHVADAGNITLNLTALNNPDLNNNPYALIYVTQNWNPPESGAATYNDSPIGVQYLGGAWYIANVDGAPMPPTAAFNVYYTWGRGNSFLVSASASNSSGSSTTLNNPLLNQTPNAIPIISSNLSPAGMTGGTYTPTVGVRYYSPLSAWQIFNGGPTFVITQTNNVLIPGPGTSFIVTATSPFFNAFEIDNALINNHPNLLVFVSPRDNGGIYPHNVGVYFDESNRWSIFDENPGDFIPVGASYDVFVAGQKLFLPLIKR